MNGVAFVFGLDRAIHTTNFTGPCTTLAFFWKDNQSVLHNKQRLLRFRVLSPIKPQASLFGVDSRQFL